jgi:hypothetical protein
VNSLALIEFTHDFFKTYAAILDHVTPLPIPVRCQIGLKGARSLEHPLWMAPYGLHSIGYEAPARKFEAPTDAVVKTLQVEATAEKPHIQPGEVAYVLIEQIYNWFGLQSDTIPYASAEAREIDATTFAT